MPTKKVDPTQLREAVSLVHSWLRDEQCAEPTRTELAAAVRLSLRTVEQLVPGHTLEVRVPPFAAIQCLAGPRHTRGTPPNVVEMSPRTWLLLASGLLDWAGALDQALVTASGTRTDLSVALPVLRLPDLS